jgi:hypothetical protein
VWFTRVSSFWIGDPRCSRPTRRERSHPSRLPATRSETTENLAEILPRVDCPPGVATSFHHSVCASFPASCCSATLRFFAQAAPPIDYYTAPLARPAEKSTERNFSANCSCSMLKPCKRCSLFPLQRSRSPR